MAIFQHARRPRQWLRVLLAALLLAFVLDTVAHTTHQHEGAPAGSHAVLCGYCAVFANAADGPAAMANALLGIATTQPFQASSAWHAPRPAISARPRAPPSS